MSHSTESNQLAKEQKIYGWAELPSLAVIYYEFFNKADMIDIGPSVNLKTSITAAFYM